MLRKLTETKLVKSPMARKTEVYIPLNRIEGSNCSQEGMLTREEIREFARKGRQVHKVTAWQKG